MSWNTERLGNLLAPSGFDRGGSNEYPILSITMHDGLIDQSEKFKKRVASRDISSYRVVYANELVVGFPIDEGVLGFQTRYPAAVVSPAYGIWKLKRPAEIHIPFFQGYLRSSEARQIYISRMRGAVARRRSISREDFLDINIPLPPLDEQKRIAAVLDKAETLLRYRQESFQLTEQLLQSVFIDMFGHSEAMPQPKLAEILTKSLRNGLSPSSGGFHRDTVFTLSAITRGYFDSDARKEAMFAAPPRVTARVNATDFLICRGNGNLRLCGRGQFPTDDAVGVVFPDTIIAASIDVARVSKAYFETVWNQPFVRRQIESGARTANGIHKINQTTLENIRIPLPDFHAQVAFSQIAQWVKLTAQNLGVSAKHMENLFLALQQRAFRGELDLSRLILAEVIETAEATETAAVVANEGRYRRPGCFIAPPEIEAQMMALEHKLDLDPNDTIAWDENYFKYRTLSQVLQPPFSFSDIWEAVENDMEEVIYDKVKDKIFEYVEEGTLEQQLDEARKEIVFVPRP